MDNAKRGCWLGCALLSSLLVALAFLLLVYVILHREEWRLASIEQFRATLEAGISEDFPPGTSEESIERLCAEMERKALSTRLTNDQLETLRDRFLELETVEGRTLEDWADVLEVLAAALGERRVGGNEFKDLKAWRGQWDFDHIESATATLYLDKLHRAMVSDASSE